MSLLTVVLLTYNRPEKYLREAIKGILNQTLKDFEFIIYDNGSTITDVAKIVESYHDERIIILRKNENRNAHDLWTEVSNLV